MSTVSHCRLWPAPAEAHEATCFDLITYATTGCVLGRILVARRRSRIGSILIGATDNELIIDLVRRFPTAQFVADDGVVREDLLKVTRYLDDPGEGLCLPIEMNGTPFQRNVWWRVRSIGVGRTIAYWELARLISPFASPLAVEDACLANPVALAVPCHRVVRSTRDIGPYRWGAECKRELIRREAMT